MGLDIVEFVMDVEESFGISIPDDTAATLSTPRKLIDYVYGRVHKSDEARCLTQRAFYAVRHELTSRLNLHPSQLRPNTELRDVLPSAGAQKIWAEVGECLNIPSWPRVRGQGWLARMFLPERPRTVGDAARHVATFAPRVLKRHEEGWSWCEVAAVVDRLMDYHFAIRDYSVDDRFVEDLGLD